MHPLIFVYGTLRPACDHAMARWLAQRSRVLGPASVQGNLLRVAHYPGLVAGAGQVYGDLLELEGDGLTAVVAELDAYEGGEYCRELSPVRLLDGAEARAWIYWYTADTVGLNVITSGDWLYP